MIHCRVDAAECGGGGGRGPGLGPGLRFTTASTGDVSPVCWGLPSAMMVRRKGSVGLRLIKTLPGRVIFPLSDPIGQMSLGCGLLAGIAAPSCPATKAGASLYLQHAIDSVVDVGAHRLLLIEFY